MSNRQDILVQQQHMLQDKRRYFLLGSVGAAVGFVVTQLNPANANEYLWVLMLALCLLAGSFVAGLYGISLTNKLLHANHRYFDAVQAAATQGYNEKVVKQVADEMSFEPLGRKLHLSNQIQVISLAVGSALVPIWKTLSCDLCITMLAKTLRME